MSASSQARQIQKVYSEWSVKAAEIILASRIEDSGRRAPPQPAASSFNLKVPELFNVRAEEIGRPEFFQFKAQRAFQVELYIQPDIAAESVPASSSSSSACDVRKAGDDPGELLERWTFTFSPAQCAKGLPVSSAALEQCNQTLIQKLSVALRSLLCFTRLLPAYHYLRSGQANGRRTWQFHAEAWPPASRPAPTQEMVGQEFICLPSSVGTVRLSVMHRKDLKAAAAAPRSAPTTGSSQIEDIEVEEGYFGHTEVEPVAALGRLDKIAEEPEVRRTRRSTSAAAASSSAEQDAVTFDVAGKSGGSGERVRTRQNSVDSLSSAKSASSLPVAVPEHAVVLSAAPALAMSTMHRQPPAGSTAGDSAPSSKASSPLCTPKLGPSSPPEHFNASSVSDRCDDVSDASACKNLDPGYSYRLGSMRSRASSGSRSLSREDSGQLRFSAADVAGRRSSRSGSEECIGLGNMHGGADDIHLFGMSSDEEPFGGAGDSHAVFAATLPQSTSSGGAIAGAADHAGGLDLDKLVAGLESLERDGGSLHSSKVSRRSVRSPLIAALNPFGTHPWEDDNADPLKGMSDLELPPAESDRSNVSSMHGCRSASCRTQDYARSASPKGDSRGRGIQGVASCTYIPQEVENKDGGEELHRLLVDMGDLVRKLQQKRELAIASQEISSEDLLSSLDHFRLFRAEFATGP